MSKVQAWIRCWSIGPPSCRLWRERCSRRASSNQLVSSLPLVLLKSCTPPASNSRRWTRRGGRASHHWPWVRVLQDDNGTGAMSPLPAKIHERSIDQTHGSEDYITEALLWRHRWNILIWCQWKRHTLPLHLTMICILQWGHPFAWLLLWQICVSRPTLS